MNRSIKIQGYEDRVRKVIYDSGMSIKEVSRQMDCDSKMFYNGHQMNLGNLAKFCAITGCSADYILGLRREVRR